MKINPEAVPTAEEMKNQVLEFHANKGGQTVVVIVRVILAAQRTRFSEPKDGYYIEGELLGADFSTAIDDRIARQQASIERLLAHLKTHCPEVGPGFPTLCPFMEEQRIWKKEAR